MKKNQKIKLNLTSQKQTTYDSDNKDANSISQKVAHIKDLLINEYKRVTIMFLIFFVLVAATVAVSKSFSASEEEAILNYNKYLNTLYAKDANDNYKPTKKVILPSETAVDIDKVNADIKVAEDFFENIFNFKNGDEYDKARDNVIKMFGEKNDLAKYVFEKNARLENGNSYVDAFKINMKMTRMQTYLTNVDDENSYTSIITIESSGEDRTATYLISTDYKVDKNNNLVDCSVYFLRG